MFLVLRANVLINYEQAIFYISHNISAIRNFCRRAFLIESGQLVADGDPPTIVDRYLHGAAHKHASNF